MSMMQTTDIGGDVKALLEALDFAYPDVNPRQIADLTLSVPAVLVQDHDEAVAHAKWVIRSIVQNVTEQCLLSAADGLLWLRAFIAENEMRLCVGQAA